MATGRAVSWTVALPWLVALLTFSSMAAADAPPTITIAPTDPPTAHSVDIRLYEFFNSGVGWNLLRDDVVGNVIEIEHFFDITNLPTTTEFDETYLHEFLGGEYVLRWTRHFEYAGQIRDEVLELPFSVPLTEPVTLSLEAIPVLDAWSLGIATVLLGLTLLAGTRKIARRSPGKT